MSVTPEILASVNVPLGARSYDIIIGTGLIASLGAVIKPLLKRPSVIIITDINVAEHYLATSENAFRRSDIKVQSIVVPAGEATKSFSQYQELSEKLLAMGGERGDTLIALGGGVVGDITGFVAATLRRGMDFIQVPTSLLAQVDSSVGGKTGINTASGKNLVGAFHQPKAVVIDIETLLTLPRRELLAGYAEVVKYGLIDRPDFYYWLEDKGEDLITGSKGLLAEAIAECCSAKAQIVAEDELEQGKRALLNLGHTFGHAIEAECGYDGTILHGEAVAVGMVLAHELSAAMELVTAPDVERIRGHLAAVGLPTSLSDINQSFDIQRLASHMSNDKKVSDGRITFVLSRGLGAAVLSQDVEMAAVEKVLAASASRRK